MRRVSPLGALLAGTAAGAFGAWVMDLFFSATKKIAPQLPENVFSPPELQQEREGQTETVARRVVEHLAQRGPLEDTARAGEIVHYVYGATWAGLYGLVAATSRPARSLPGGLAFGTIVWAISEGLVLPLFRLAPWPRASLLRNHAYSLASHLVYGAATAGATHTLLRLGSRPALAALGALWLTRKVPSGVRPVARTLTRRGVGIAIRARDVVEAVR
ncbi:MAG: hypothetical protein DIU78_010420 [Pseudomonadota bacterium]